MNKPSVEVIGASNKSMNDALTHALADIGDQEADYEVLETISKDVNGEKQYQITIKVSLEGAHS